MRKLKIRYSKDTILDEIYASNKISDVVSYFNIKNQKIIKLKTIQELIDLSKNSKENSFINGMKIIDLDGSIFSIGKTLDIDYIDIASHPFYKYFYLFEGKDTYVCYTEDITEKTKSKRKETKNV